MHRLQLALRLDPLDRQPRRCLALALDGPDLARHQLRLHTAVRFLREGRCGDTKGDEEGEKGFHRSEANDALIGLMARRATIK